MREVKSVGFLWDDFDEFCLYILNNKQSIDDTLISDYVFVLNKIIIEDMEFRVKLLNYAIEDHKMKFNIQLDYGILGTEKYTILGFSYREIRDDNDLYLLVRSLLKQIEKMFD